MQKISGIKPLVRNIMQQFENYRCFSGEQQVWQH
ncbi:S-formylglutathione hydrolase, partial [Mannheimia haemolytica]